MTLGNYEVIDLLDFEIVEYILSYLNSARVKLWVWLVFGFN